MREGDDLSHSGSLFIPDVPTHCSVLKIGIYLIYSFIDSAVSYLVRHKLCLYGIAAVSCVNPSPSALLSSVCEGGTLLTAVTS